MENTYIVKILKQPAKPYRKNSARAKYWTRVCKYADKDVLALVRSVDKVAPSQPVHGKLAGKTEPLTGWLNYFAHNGLLEVVAK